MFQEFNSLVREKDKYCGHDSKYLHTKAVIIVD